MVGLVFSFVYRAIARFNLVLNSMLNGLQTRNFLCIGIVSFMLLATNVTPDFNNQALTKQLNNEIHQDDSQRPKTTAEWNQQAEETQGRPAERLKRIGEQSVEAVKEFAEMYPDTAERSADSLAK
jgi:hypothetical protein